MNTQHRFPDFDQTSGSGPENKSRTMLYYLLDFLLLSLSFLVLALATPAPGAGSEVLLHLWAVFSLFWLPSSLLTGKGARLFRLGLPGAVLRLTWAAALLCLFVSIILVLLQLTGFSRLLIYGTVGLFFLLELAAFSLWSLRLRRTGRLPLHKASPTSSGSRVILPLAFLDGLLLFSAFTVVHFFKRGDLHLDGDDQFLLQIMFLVWTGVSLSIRKFSKDVLPNALSGLEVTLKGAVLMAGGLAALIVALDLFHYSRTQIFGTLLVLFCLEQLPYGLYFAFRSSKTQERDITTAKDMQDLIKQQHYVLPKDSPGQGQIPEKPVRSSLRAGLELIQPWLFDYLDQNLDLMRINKEKTRIVNVDDYANLELLTEGPGLCLLLNLYKSNDQRFLNRYFLEVHRLLKPGGYFVGKVQTYRNIRGRFKRKYSRNLAFCLSLLQFIVHRILPKLPLSKQAYFAVTKGRNRAISKAEVLGRLSFCGFQIIQSQDEKDFLYFIARKIRHPSTVKDPTYGPLVKLKRSGAGGQPITVYKFRTMHPYSEFLQDYIYELNKLSPGGKIANDFRITEWGRILRKLWIDELTMLYNWLRGDLQLIGVRPLSRHFFSLYPKHLQKLRQQSKPGLLPPFYADLPESLEEICASEEKYLKAYNQAPLKTQTRYLVLTLYNILVRGARSG